MRDFPSPRLLRERISPAAVTVRATDRHGNTYDLSGTELLARAICHECDHLDGKLFTDVVIKDAKKPSKK